MIALKKKKENKNKKIPILSGTIFSINNILSIIKKYLTLEEMNNF